MSEDPVMPEGPPVTPWSWLAPALWRCPKCCAVYLVRELGARCRLCGYYEDE